MLSHKADKTCIYLCTIIDGKKWKCFKIAQMILRLLKLPLSSGKWIVDINLNLVRNYFNKKFHNMCSADLYG